MITKSVIKGTISALLALTLTAVNAHANANSKVNSPSAAPGGNNLIGYWISGGRDSKNIIHIKLARNEETNEIETQLVGFDMKLYSGQPTTMWDQADRPALKFSSDGSARTSIDNISLRRDDKSHVIVNLDIKATSENGLLISHGTASGAKTHELFVRLSEKTAAPRFLQTARERARELARLYFGLSHKNNCKSMTLTMAIERYNLNCVREIGADKDNISEQDLMIAAKNLDYSIVKFLMARYQGSTDNVIAQLAVLPPPPPQSINGGKYFSLELDREPIIAMLMTKAAN